jgi:1,5-anhydro-D-fructose reductase (1,5-anhydro-D-mannitol-forming)
VRILVVGHGLIGRQRAAAAHELATLAATIDPVEREPSLYGGAPHLLSLQDASDLAYDAAVIALPHDLAVQTAHQILAGGRPVLVEKPLGLAAAEARGLEEAAAALKLPSFVGYNYRFLPHVGELFDALARGELGRLRSIDLLIGHGGHPESAKGWKLRPERAGGGVLLDPGVHLLDLLLLLAPDVEPALAVGTRGFWGTGIEEDLLLAFSSGENLLASVRISHIRWVNTMRFEIFGNDGYAILEGRGGRYGPMRSRLGRRWAWADGPQGRSQRGTETVTDHGTANLSLRDELEAVLAAWGGAPLPDAGRRPATFADGRRVTELVERLYAQLVG